MRAFLYGISSLSYWLAATVRPGSTCAVGKAALQTCTPNQDMVDYLESRLPFLPPPHHLLVPGKAKSTSENAVVHTTCFDYEGKPFYRIGRGIFASSPELCFAQLALDLPFHELVKAGNALCGRFAIDPTEATGLKERKPLTSKAKIKAFVRRNHGLRGANRAAKAANSLADNAASPPESFLWAVLSLSQRYGGYGVPDLVMNKRIKPSKQAQRIACRETLIPDLFHAEARLVIEYDSNSEHLTPSQITRDSTKRLALEADKYKVITVTTRQLAKPSEMRSVAIQASKQIGRRLQIRGKHFDEQHRLLYAAGWSLRDYHKGLSHNRKIRGRSAASK